MGVGDYMCIGGLIKMVLCFIFKCEIVFYFIIYFGLFWYIKYFKWFFIKDSDVLLGGFLFIEYYFLDYFVV